MADISPVPFINFGNENAQVGLTGAQTAEAQQRAQEIGLKNQITQAAMPLIKQGLDEAMADQTGANTGADTSGVRKNSHGWYDGDNIEQQYRDANFVPPVTQQEMAKMKAGAALKMATGNSAMWDMAMQQRQLRVETATATNQLNMGNVYDAMTRGVLREPNRAYYAALQKVAPDAAAKIDDHLGADASIEAKNQEAKEFAERVAFNSHLYSGRPTKMDNGMLLDEKAGEPVPGQEQVFTGLSPKERQEEYDKWIAPVQVPMTGGGTQEMARWQAPPEQGGTNGKITPAQQVARADAVARNLRSQRDNEAASAGTGNAPATVPPGQKPANTPARQQQRQEVVQTRAVRQPPSANAKYTPPPALKEGETPPQPGTPEYGDRVRASLNDPKYADPMARIQNRPGTPEAGVAEKLKMYLTQKQDAQAEFNDHAKAASTAIMNFTEAKKVLDGYYDGRPLTNINGFPAQVIAEIANKLGINSVTANTRAEVAKYLTNAAVAGIKDTYGSRPGVYDVKINVEKAFPSIDMPAQATTSLINSQIRQARYMYESSVRGQAYIDRGNAPLKFNDYNEEYFPRTAYVTERKEEKPKAPANRPSLDTYFTKK